MDVETKEYTGKGQGIYNSVAGSAGLLAFADRFLGGGGCGNGGILGGLLGGNRNGCGNGGMDAATIMALMAAGNGCGCGHEPVINRYEAGLAARISELETDVKLRDANTYTLTKMGELRDYVDAKFSKVDDRLCKQIEWNTAQSGALNCMASQIAQFYGLTKLVVPNSSVCPGWGGVTIAPATTPTAAG